MKDFLETLELGDNKYKLSKEEIKSILAEHGKSVKTESEKVENNYKSEIEDYKNTIQELKGQIDKLPKTDELESLRSQVADYEKKEQQRKAEEEDNILTNNILETIKDKKFINDYTKDAIVNEVKSALKDKNNAGKSAKDLFESITKDKSGIFQNDNQFVDMADMKPTDDVDSKPRSEGIKLNPMFKTYN